MGDVQARDGVRLHWEERGSGPSVLLSPYWNMHPTIFDRIEEALLPDFRVVRYDERGTGKSERVGPYTMDAGTDDLRAVCEQIGPFEAALCLVDSTNRAVRIADSDPELMGMVFSVGSAPFGVGALKDSESLLSSETVIRTFLQQLQADYRGALRAAISGADDNQSEEDVRDRVQMQLEYCDAEAAAVRAREWAGDSGGQEPGRRIGNRLSVCLSKSQGGRGSWFPAAEETGPLIQELFPEAQLHWAEDGIVSAPDEVAGLLKASLEAVANTETYHRQP